MKASGYLLSAAGLLLAGVAWFAWTDPLGTEPVVREQRPQAAPPAPVEVAAQRPTYRPEATGPGGRRWTRLNDEGIAALEAGEVTAAIEAFEACHEGDPDEPVYAHNLAEALTRAAMSQHERGEAEERLAAIQMLERATRLDPSREKLKGLLGRWKRSEAAEEGFFVHRTTHFEVAYDLARDEVRGEIDQVGELLEEAYLTFSEAFAVRPVEEGRPRIRAVLYTREGFDRVTGIGPWAGGVYDGTIRVPVGDLRRELARVRTVLRHELLHAFVQVKGGPQVPAWLNEGLAQWLEQDTPAARAAEVERARARLAGHALFDLDTLAGSLASWEDEDAIARAYAQALALVGWIGDRYQNNDVQSVGVLFEMVAACGEGEPVSETFERRIGLSLETVQEDMAVGL